ncbi:FapA family protein [Desulfobacula sp.]|uniref:FapA family protein n=1 Tax=Desulfobacula sp. TaxID=2593537 RepID=UPI0026069619|nr:FapA family protein [Desulfobacula sp.]
MGNDGKLHIPLIGILAVKHGLITEENLQTGVSRCSGAKDLTGDLKTYFLSNELISVQNMERLFRAAKAIELRKKEFKFGAIAIQKGLINRSVLKLVLEEQKNDIINKKKFRLIGDLLIEAGMLTTNQRDDILRSQKRLQAEPNTRPEEKNEFLSHPETLVQGINLKVSEDFMAAFLIKTDVFDPTITPAQIKEALSEKGIVKGLVKDEQIQGFIFSTGFKTKYFRVANGVPPVKGKGARLEFFFNTDYVKAGDLTKAEGVSGFKERGDIPYLEKGTVLAEKIPMIAPRTGYTVFGEEIETTPGRDMVLKLGKGTTLSEDGFKVLSTVRGSPKYSLSGQIRMVESYFIDGDGDDETGHLDYDGNVQINGRITSGCKVTGNDITAMALEGGQITAEGNVTIAGGVEGAKIYSRGNVTAAFIHNSEVVCMGNVIIEREIVDTDVDCSGSCLVEAGTLISSRITAKMGVKACHIGTEKADPCVIKVGHDVFVEKELAKNRARVDALNGQMGRHQANKERLTATDQVLQKQIADLSRLKNLKRTAQKAEALLEACFDKGEQIEAKLKKTDREIDILKKRLGTFLDEKTHLIAWASDNPGNPVVVVAGAILPGTHIAGEHSEMRVDRLIRHAKIKEVLGSDGDGTPAAVYRLEVENR